MQYRNTRCLKLKFILVDEYYVQRHLCLFYIILLAMQSYGATFIDVYIYQVPRIIINNLMLKRDFEKRYFHYAWIQ